ncbi:MAG: hypothetical protein JO354_07320 [Verrucomicrobia bacterium]|nr:hypothetical protein [Verrucomicrobiota bacterium]
MNRFASIRTSLQRVAFGLLLAFGATQAKATLVQWNLNPSSLNGPVGSSTYSYTQSGYSISATGYDNPTTTHDLFFKNGGGDETGLGLVNTLDNELQVNNGVPANYIQLNIQSLITSGFYDGKIEVGSVQPGESFNLYGSSSAGTLGTLLGTYGNSADAQFVAVPSFGNYNYVTVTAAVADVLPIAFQANICTPVPEMNALLPIAGLLCVVALSQVLRRRKLAAVTE